MCSLNYFKSWRFTVCMWVDLCVWLGGCVRVDVYACRQGWPGEGEGGDGPHREATRLHLLHGRAPGHSRRVCLPQGSCPLLPRYQPPVVVFRFFFWGGGGGLTSESVWLASLPSDFAYCKVSSVLCLPIFLWVCLGGVGTSGYLTCRSHLRNWPTMRIFWYFT